MEFRVVITLTHLFFVFNIVYATLSPPDKKEQKSIKPQEGPRKNNVLDRQLVTETPLVKDIIKYHATYHQDVSTKHFPYPTLGFITPWNNVGYNVAKRWASKFNYISPVWLQIKRQGPNSYVVTGLQDVDHGWMKDVRSTNGSMTPEIIPRIILEEWPLSDLKAFFTEPTFESEQQSMIDKVKKTCKQWNFDGVVLEILSQIGKYVAYSVEFIQKFGSELKEEGLTVILVYPPYRGFAYEDFYQRAFENLFSYVTATLIMTYDFSNPQRPGPNAPLDWIDLCIEKLLVEEGYIDKRSRMFLGLNFYGNSYTANGGGPIIGSEYIELLKSAKSNQILTYSNQTGEHYIEVKTSQGTQKIFYPTLYSIQKRLELAAHHKVGVAIWELGQGLPYFYDLF